jgi:hypothetical protein
LEIHIVVEFLKTARVIITLSGKSEVFKFKGEPSRWLPILFDGGKTDGFFVHKKSFFFI